VHYFGYRKIKYQDDGRDYVSIKEFFSVHVTFSVLNSWMTYFFCYIMFVYLSGVLWKNDTKEKISLLQEYFSISVMVLMMFETTVYLAYYKDVVFAINTLFNYIGMYLNFFDHRNNKTEEI
jgi:hypothetical protein